jgi:hypothetical protein
MLGEQGAHDMDVNACNPDVLHNMPLLLALLGVWNRNFLGHQTCAVLPYSQMLVRLTYVCACACACACVCVLLYMYVLRMYVADVGASYGLVVASYALVAPVCLKTFKASYVS